MTTIGELTNVPQPGTPVASLWAQDTTNRIRHRYPSKAALDGWTLALVGTVAVTTDNGIVYQRVGAGWARVTPRFGSIPGSAGVWADSKRAAD
jgi:hypothetical protein